MAAQTEVSCGSGGMRGTFTATGRWFYYFGPPDVTKEVMALVACVCLLTNYQMGLDKIWLEDEE